MRISNAIRCLLVSAAMLVSASLAAQNLTVKGVVKDSDGAPLPGATVYVPGTTIGTVTDAQGNFSLQVNANTDVEVSFLGYGSQIIKVGATAPAFQEITLSDSEQLSEVVVTALGVAREKKTLGYALQEVKGDALVQAHENNITNALSGKVAGLQVIRGANGPGSSSKIVLRGNNSLTGLNQPLIVVDGVPIDDFVGASNNDFWNPSADMGNGLQDINPEDVESMTVLKGASAAALYGSRAGNGVILITTKKGRENPGLGITITGSVAATTVFTAPDMQMKYGQGSLGIYDPESGASWGPEITGQSYTRWDGANVTMKAYDNVASFFDTGINNQQNITFQQQYGNNGIYASFTRMNDDSMIPYAGIKRTNLMLRGTSVFGKNNRWSFDGKVQYIKSGASNRPISGSNASSSFIQMFNLPVSIDVTEFADPLDANGNMYWYSGLSDNNPYWIAKYRQSEDTRDRFLLTGTLKYKFTDWLDAELRAGSDMYTTETTNKIYGGNQHLANAKGSYSMSESRFFENNFSFLLTAKKDNLWDEFGAQAQFGGNLMERESRSLSSSMSTLNIRDYFDLNNTPSGSKPSVSEGYSHRKMNSLYGTVQLNYGGFVFLEGTWRNDWTSTLSAANRSFFYPSVSLSWVISDMVDKYGAMPEWFSYAKLRASYAMVGNDLNPYQLYNEYTVGSAQNNTPITGFNSQTLYNADVKNELIKSFEVGADIRFFDNRLGLDVAYYKTNATNQLIDLPMNSLSGYNSKKVNAGNIQNKGFELMLNATPIRTNKFEWLSSFNMSHNNNTILELADGVEEYGLGTMDNMKIVAKVGGAYGEIYGSKFARVEDETSPYFGQLILNSDGLPTAVANQYLGNQNYKMLLGWTNTFNIGNFSASFQLDARLGGKMFSGTLMSMENSGTALKTAKDGRGDMVVEGVIKQDDGSYVKNTTATTTQKYWQQISGKAGGNLGITEANFYDATNIRLRNISLSYSLPKRICQNTGFLQSLKLGASVTNVVMLYSRMDGLDPESVYALSSNVTGYEYGSSPTSRCYVFNITLGF